MSKADLVTQHFLDKGIKLAGSVIEDHGHDECFVFVSVEIDSAGKRVPSNYAISNAENTIGEELGKVTVVLVSQGDQDVVESIRSMVMGRFFADIRYVFSSVNGGKVSVWIEPKAATNAQKSKEIHDTLAKFIECFGLSLGKFVNTAELNLPSKTACLSAIRLKSPVSPEDVESELGRRGFEIPDRYWLLRRLDRWRRSQLIHRKQNGLYVMTFKGLAALGSSTGRWSPDVSRALELARRTR